MSNIVLKGSTSGDVTITVPAAAGTNTVTIPAATGNLPLSDLEHVTNRPFGNPIFVNGNMAIAQRAVAAVTGLGDGDEGYVTVDRIRHTHDGTTAGRYTSSQDSVTDLPGFHESLKIDCTTADTSIAAGEGMNLEYKFEGLDLHHLQKGHASAKPFTIAFYAKADAALTYGVEFKDTDNNRHCTRRFTTTTGWTRHVLNFPADTSGKYTNDNAHSASFRFWLHAGSNFASGTAATVFQGVTTANTAAGDDSIFANTGRFINITGLQMEIGTYDSDTIPPFQYECYGDNLRRCERYCQSSYSQGTAIGTATTAGVIIFNATGTGTGQAAHGFPLRTVMRAVPTLVIFKAGATDTGVARNGNDASSQNMAAGAPSTSSMHVENSDGTTNAVQLQFQFSAIAEL